MQVGNRLIIPFYFLYFQSRYFFATHFSRDIYQCKIINATIYA